MEQIQNEQKLEGNSNVIEPKKKKIKSSTRLSDRCLIEKKEKRLIFVKQTGENLADIQTFVNRNYPEFKVVSEEQYYFPQDVNVIYGSLFTKVRGLPLPNLKEVKFFEKDRDFFMEHFSLNQFSDSKFKSQMILRKLSSKCSTHNFHNSSCNECQREYGKSGLLNLVASMDPYLKQCISSLKPNYESMIGTASTTTTTQTPLLDETNGMLSDERQKSCDELEEGEIRTPKTLSDLLSQDSSVMDKIEEEVKINSICHLE